MSNIHTAFPSLNSGDEFKASDAQGMSDGMRTLLGNAISGIIGAQTAIPMLNPFTVIASGGMGIAAGGPGGQALYLDSGAGPRYVDNAPAQSFTIAASTSQGRNDLLCASYTTPQPLSTLGTRKNEATDGTITTVTSNTQSESVTYQIVQGTPSATPADPVVPTGFIAIARIVVGPSVSSIVQSNIMIIPQTMQALILSAITATGYVDRTTNQSVAGNKNFTGTTTVGGLAFANTDTAFSGIPGVRVNTPGSILVSPAGPGHTVNLGYDDSGCLGIFFGPGNAWGKVTLAGYTSPDATAIYGTNASVTNGFFHAGPSSPAAFVNIGDGVFEHGNTTGRIYLGNSGLIFLDFDGANYDFGGGGGSGNAGVKIAGAVSVGGYVHAGASSVATFAHNGDGVFEHGDTTGRAYLGNSGLIYLDFDGANYAFGAGGGSGTAGVSIAGALTVGGTRVASSYASSDSSVIPLQTGNALDITLPSGFVNLYTSSAGTTLPVRTGRTLNIDVASGLTYRATSRPAPSSYPYTSPALTLAPLPGPISKQYIVTAYMSCDLNASGVQTLSLGGCATNESTKSQQDGGGGSQPIEISGTAVGGSTPSVTWTNSNGLGSTNWIGLLTIEAIAI